MTCKLTDQHNKAITDIAEMTGREIAKKVIEAQGSPGAARQGFLNACAKGFDDQVIAEANHGAEPA